MPAAARAGSFQCISAPEFFDDLQYFTAASSTSSEGMGAHRVSVRLHEVSRSTHNRTLAASLRSHPHGSPNPAIRTADIRRCIAQESVIFGKGQPGTAHEIQG